MKQKIVIKVQMACEKCKAKAMSIGAVAEGVTSLAIEGADKDRLVVIGEDVDPAKLICKLRKKLCCYVTLITVEEVKPKPPEDKKKTQKEKEKEKKPSCSCCIQHPQYPVCNQYPQYPCYPPVVCDPNPGGPGCSIQ